MERGNEWTARVAADVGKRVAYFRDKSTDLQGRKLTVQALSVRTGKLGLPLARPTISKLEKGLRQSVTVDEVMVLALALEVSPLDLIFPACEAATVEAWPGQVLDTWKAVLWFAGIAQRPGRPAPVYENGVIWLYQVHYQLIDDWTLAGESHRRTIVTGLRGIRADLAGRGLLVPQLPGEIAAAVEAEERAG